MREGGWGAQVGDPLQLPATVLSPSAVAAGYALSLFQRLQGAGYPVHMLRTQYRMHSQIRHFPSAQFYDNQVVDGEGVDTVTARAWHAKRIFGPFFFFDLEHGEETQPGGSTGSRVNVREAEFVVQLYRQLSAWHPELKNTRRVGIISPYKFQVKLIREKLKESGQEGTQLVDVNTVDGFQVKTTEAERGDECAPAQPLLLPPPPHRDGRRTWSFSLACERMRRGGSGSWQTIGE